MTEQVIRVGARAVWPGQGWSLTLAVHALNMCKVLENFDGARAIFEHEYAEAVRAGAPVLMSGLAVAYADVLLRLGRLEEALELVEQTSALIDRRVLPWPDLAAAVLCSELGLDDARAGAPSRRCATFQREIPARAVRGRLAVAAAARRRAAQLAAGRTRRPPTRCCAPARSRRSAGGSSRAWCRGPRVAIEAHLAAGRVEVARGAARRARARAVDAPEPLAAGGDRARPRRARGARGPARARRRALPRGDRALRGAAAAARARPGADRLRHLSAPQGPPAGRPRAARARRSRSARTRAPSASRASPAPSSRRAAAAGGGAARTARR